MFVSAQSQSLRYSETRNPNERSHHHHWKLAITTQNYTRSAQFRTVRIDYSNAVLNRLWPKTCVYVFVQIGRKSVWLFVFACVWYIMTALFHDCWLHVSTAVGLANHFTRIQSQSLEWSTIYAKSSILLLKSHPIIAFVPQSFSANLYGATSHFQRFVYCHASAISITLIVGMFWTSHDSSVVS